MNLKILWNFTIDSKEVPVTVFLSLLLFWILSLSKSLALILLLVHNNTQKKEFSSV